LGSRRFGDQRERSRRDITPDPLADGESGEVRRGNASGLALFSGGRSEFGFDLLNRRKLAFQFLRKFPQGELEFNIVRNDLPSLYASATKLEQSNTAP